MSAFIVEDKSINRIVAFLADCHCRGKVWLYLPLERIGFNLSEPLQVKRLAEEMATLNCMSVEGRYGEGQADKMGGCQAFVHTRTSPLESNKWQVLKSLACFLYQSCEGDCEENALYQALEAIRGKLSYHLVSDLPQFETAQWE